MHAEVPTRTLAEMIYAYPTVHPAVEDAPPIAINSPHAATNAPSGPSAGFQVGGSK